MAHVHGLLRELEYSLTIYTCISFARMLSNYSYDVLSGEEN